MVKLIIALEELNIKAIQELLHIRNIPASGREFIKALEITDIELGKLIKNANLRSIEGIGEREAELLETMGIDTAKELARRNAVDLIKIFESYGEEKDTNIPSEEEVAKWIEQAKN